MKHIKLSVCDSTQDELKAHPEDRVLVSTENQSKGRGRGDHFWEHAKGSLAFSFSCAPHPELTWQSLEVSVLLHQFIFKKFGVRLQLKWPNDLYHQDKKCAGILLHHLGKKMHIGVGINVLAHSQWGGILSDHSLWSQSMCHDLPLEFTQFYLSQTSLSVESIKDYWLKFCFHLSKAVTLSEGSEEHVGVFTGLGADGEALIEGKSYFNGSLRIKDL